MNANALGIDRAETGLVLVDAQVKLAGAMPQAIMERVLRNWLALIETGARFQLPVAASEQYPKGLGPVMPVTVPGRPVTLTWSSAVTRPSPSG